MAEDQRRDLPPLPARGKGPRGQPWLWVGTAVASLVIGALVAVVFLGGDDPPPKTAKPAKTATKDEPVSVGESLDGVSAEPGAGGSLPPLASYSPPGREWTADLPSGSGWSPPRDEQISAGYSRTSVDGPDGGTVYVDFTPGERPSTAFASSREAAPLPSFPSAELVTVDGGEGACLDTTCFDYLLPSTIRAGGYAVLTAIPGDEALARRLVRRIARSFIEAGE